MILSTTKIENRSLISDVFEKKLFTIAVFRDKKSGISRFFREERG
ncbi:glucose-inhibited division protein A [Vibrio gigantis]|uniref:Glucose-inhibited division protein A n=1 Tax=Vibrio gigantis TaxID=296199 RepID=A0A5M9N981_9VIBR|nr:glucose-inhibited division protein A [Vibrio gigantis]